MKKLSFPNFITLATLIVVFVIVCFGCGNGITYEKFRVDQNIENCRDDTLFQVNTFAYEDGNIIFSHRSWSASGNICLRYEQVDSCKKVDYAKAEKFISLYKKTNKK